MRSPAPWVRSVDPAMQEMARVLEPKGNFVVAATNRRLKRVTWI